MHMKTHRPLTVAALLLSMSLAAMEATVVATAMPTVISDLGGLAVYGWVGAAYLLASTVTVPLYGKLADRVGRKPVLLFGIALFLSGSLACGLARSIGQLIAFRALQGLGAGAVQPTVLTVIGDLYSPTERGRIQGLFGAIWGISGICGPMLGGTLAAALSWRWIFLINLPFGAAAAVILLFAFREAPRTQPRSRVDVLGGCVLMSLSLSLLLAASDVVPLLTGPAGISLAALFVAIERRAIDPILPLQLIGRRLVAVASAASLLLGAAMTSTMSYLPLHVQGVLLGDPADAGLVLSPMLVAWPIASALTTRMLSTIGYRHPVRIGVLLSTAGLLLIAWLITVRAAISWLCLGTFVFGFGMGLANTAILIGIQASVGFEQRGTATAVTLFARTMGGALGVGALGAVLAARLEQVLPAQMVSALLDPHDRSGSIRDPMLASTLGAAIDPLFWSGAVCGLLALLVVLAYPRDEPT